MPSRCGISVPDNADQEVLMTQVPAGTTIDYIRISGTPGAGHVYNSALPGNGTNRLPRKRQHGREHYLDSAFDSEGNGARRHGDHRKCSDDGGHA
jgi:hypothetical protein